MKGIEGLKKRIENCELCPRLIEHCKRVAEVKRRQFRDSTYWGKPVPGFGDPKAALLIVGLAPAAHGANRTGRTFTGDQSGLWLYRALHRAGFSNRAESIGPGDGLKLQGCYIATAIRCAPPGNKPTPDELLRCGGFLREEIMLLPEVKVFLALGRIALHALWRQLPPESLPFRKLPPFSHGSEFRLRDGRLVFCSYHPSQQNTFTGVLTEPQFDWIFERARREILS